MPVFPCDVGKQSEIDVDKVAWHDLDPTTAAALDNIRAIAEQNPLLQKLLTNITFLWIVTEAGTIRFCIEQSYEVTSPSRRFARPRETDDNSRLLPLGHPMLTDDDSARIAGELYLERPFRPLDDTDFDDVGGLLSEHVLRIGGFGRST